mgnify:CR=1 FL=1
MASLKAYFMADDLTDLKATSDVNEHTVLGNLRQTLGPWFGNK